VSGKFKARTTQGKETSPVTSRQKGKDRDTDKGQGLQTLAKRVSLRL